MVLAALYFPNILKFGRVGDICLVMDLTGTCCLPHSNAVLPGAWCLEQDTRKFMVGPPERRRRTAVDGKSLKFDRCQNCVENEGNKL